MTLPPHPKVVTQRYAMQDLIRKDAHRALEDALERYFAGHPLYISQTVGWFGDGVEDELDIVIRPRFR